MYIGKNVLNPVRLLIWVIMFMRPETTVSAKKKLNYNVGLNYQMCDSTLD